MAVQLVGNPINRQLLFRSEIFRQRVVLIFCPKRRLVGELEIHGMLNRRDLVVVVSGRPGNDRAFIHFRLMSRIESSRFLESSFLAKFIGTKIGIPVPKLLVSRKLIEHLAPLTVPFRVL